MKSSTGFAAVLVLTLVACSTQKEKETEPVVSVEVAEVARGPIQRIVEGDGILRPVDQSAITPKISAPVSKFYVNRGDHVTKGQLLAVLENRDLAAGVADAKGVYEQASATYRNVSASTVPDEVVKAEQDVEAAREGLDAARRLLDSRRELQREGALAQRLVDEAAVASAQAKSQYETAKKHLESVQGVSRIEDVKSAEAQVASAKGKYDAAEAQLSYSEIHSPISGVVSDRAIFPGEMVSAGTPLLTVMDVSSVIARINIPQTEAAHLRVGQPARIAATDGAIQAPGKVTVVSPAVDPNATTVEVWVQAANPGERLRPGGTAHVTIMAETIPNAVVIPAAAVLPASSGGVSVMVVGPDNVAHEHGIEIGVRTADKVQILKGAAPGDRVVVQGGDGLQDGAKVRIGAPGAEAGADKNKDQKKDQNE
jgi:HlyD family secretion protein